ncbi:MAG: PH domain-containing protein [Micavibrio sp.]
MKRAVNAGRTALLKLAGITLAEGEKVRVAAHIHDAIYWKSVAVMIVGILLLPSFMQNLGFLLIAVGAVMLGLAHLTRNFLVLAATDRRIFVRSGIIYADMIELRYQQVESIELGITPIGQVFGYGSVIVTGTGQRRLIVPFVSNAISFRQQVNEILASRE